jgi:CRISPR/Cas system CSM-associated protein Csm4 (group 5 of RAMP superfamily)
MIQNIKVITLEFNVGYHVGWSRSEELIDHVTMLRSLISISSLVQAQHVINELVKGGLKATALLPVHVCGGVVKLLTRLPALPQGPGVKKGRLKWSTLMAIKHTLDFLAKCENLGGFVVLKSVDKEATFECRDRSTLRHLDEERFKIRGEPAVLCIEGEDCEHICTEHRRYYEYFHEVHTRIDRVTGSADVYRVSGVKVHTPLWLAMISPSESLLNEVIKVLGVLGDIGVGACKSRGLGRFKLVDLKIASEDLRILESHSTINKPGYVYLLGSYPLVNGVEQYIDVSRTYCYQRVLEGLSGDTFSYRLPVLRLLDIGSVIYLRDTTKLHYILQINVEGVDFKPVILFNPVIMCAS